MLDTRCRSISVSVAVPFQTRKLFDVGTAHPTVARLSFQWIEILQWFDLPKRRQEALLEIMLLNVQPAMIECERLLRDLQANAGPPPDSGSQRQSAAVYVQQLTSALHGFAGIFAPILTRDAPTANFAALAKWAAKHFGADDTLACRLKDANERWIRRVVTATNAGPLLSVEEIAAINAQLLPFFEETLLAALRHVRARIPISIEEIPVDERDPAAPVRFRAVVPDGTSVSTPAGRLLGDRVVVPELQRLLQQGHGRPIIAQLFRGEWFVATGSSLYHSPRWKTFHDFLFFYIRRILGGEWANLELKKPRGDRHPLMNWYQDVTRYMNARITTPGTPHEAPMTSLVSAYLGLAYNLYLISHNSGKVHELLVRRLQHRKNFFGAYQETVAAGILIRAGFTLELEDETDSTSSHCEFTATHKATGQKLSVEAKFRESTKHPPDIGGQLHKALRKKADHPRLVFIEVNSTKETTPDEKIAMLKALLADTRAREATMTIAGQPMPPAYLVVSNNPPGSIDTPHQPALMVEGFKMADFRMEANFANLDEALAAREKHIAMFALVDSLHEHQQIPVTFDGDLAAFAFRQPTDRLVIGRRYRMPSPEGEFVGELVQGHVMPEAKKAFCLFRTETGRSVMIECSLTDQEMAAFHESPRTFFGRAMPSPGPIRDAFKLFDQIHSTYRRSSREQLLAFLVSHPDFAALQTWPKERLAHFYSKVVTEAIMADAMRSTPG